MRVVVNGQQPFGKAVLEALIKNGDEVVLVYGPPDKEGAPKDALVDYAVSQGLRVSRPKSFKTPAVLEELQGVGAELMVMAYVTLMVPETVLNCPTHGTIQYHPSLLPKHRGPSGINWAIIQGDTRTGLTIFWPDKGLDTGPVLLQKEVEIGPDATTGSVYFDHLFPLGVEGLMEGVAMVKAGTAPKISQVEDDATYEGWCRKEQARVNWRQPSTVVYNLIRGCNPQPGAWTAMDGGATFQIYDSRRLEDVPGDTEPGTIVEAVEGGFVVATAEGGRVLVKRVKGPGQPKVPAAEFLQQGGVAVGAVLTSP